MATAFSKQDTVFFDELLASFDDRLTIARNVGVFNADPVVLERSQGTQIWRPKPYIATSTDGAAGTDISSSFADVTQLSVPISIGYNKTSPWTMTTDDLNNPLQLKRKQEAAFQKLSSDINVAIANVIGQQATLVVKRTAAPTGYDDIAEADAVMKEQGVVDGLRRNFCLHTRHYNAMAGALAKPQTSANPKVNRAYEENYVGRVSGFETYETEYTYRLTAAAGVTVTVNGANQRHVPAATTTASTGETANKDNRYQNLTIAVTSGTVKVGDRLTIAGVNSVNHITKADTGQLKTFTITAIVSGAGGSGVVTISPPIIAADSSPTQAESEYKNVTATPANGAAITFLNTVSSNVSMFWDSRAIELLPGRNGFDSSVGEAMMQGTTDVGVQLAMFKFFDINTKKFKYRVDTRFGVGLVNEEMAGIMLFSQT